eukprot:UN11741
MVFLKPVYIMLNTVEKSKFYSIQDFPSQKVKKFQTLCTPKHTIKQK